MSFAVPMAWWLAICAIPIIVFSILKVRLRRQAVSTNLFWKQIYDEKPPRSIWQHLRHLLSLLAQLLLLALLVLAAADPFLPWQRLQSRRIVAVIDRSASMQATDVTPTRFDAAMGAARSLVEGLRFRDEMAIIAAGSQPEVILGMTGHVPTLKRALRSIMVTDDTADLDSAVELARQILSEGPNGQVIVFSDGCGEELATGGAVGRTLGTESQATGGDGDATGGVVGRMLGTESQATGGDGVAVEMRTFAGPAPANVGITQFQARRSLVDPLGYELLIAVRNASDQDVQCRLEIERAGVPVDVVPIRLKPEEFWRRSLQKTSVEGGTLSARLVEIVAIDDSEKTDGNADQRKVRTPNDLQSDDFATATVPARARQHVLLITDGNLFLEKVFQANPLVNCQVLRELPVELPPGAIVIFHRRVPQVLPPVDVFIVDPVEGTEEWNVGEVLENPIITYQRSDSPLMAHVRLDNVWMHRARQVTFESPPQVLASTVSGDIVYAELQRDNGKGLLLSIDLDESDLAFRTAFPILVTNALGWFAGYSGELDGAPTPRQALAQERESDLRPAHEAPAESRVAPIAARWLVRPMWFYLICVAMAFAIVEWCLYQRRVLP